MIRRSTLLRYARSLAEVAFADGAAPQVTAAYAQLGAIAAEVPDFLPILKNPVIPSRNKLEILAALGKAFGWHPYFNDYLKVLAANHRLAHVMDIHPLFGEEMDRLDRVVKARAWTARPLAPEAVARLSETLGRVLSRRVQVSAAVDASLIGGLRVEVAGTVYDGSVKRQVERLAERLAGTS
ncbi:MAG: ATP synthase F1 subunit delta [Acidobacteria bacterium]|nr:ATP synthase F1 subunit delta [Acidobacteriota bacterium]